MKRKNIVLITAAAAACLLFSGCSAGAANADHAGNSDQAAQVTQDSSGNYVAECSADCAVIEQGLDYTVSLKVTADADGTILQVEDNGTTIPDGKDGAYQNAEALFDELKGKNADTLSDVDAVSGATYSSNAILEAVKQGLNAIANK